MEKKLAPIFRGPWRATPTVHSNRRNLFNMGRQAESHIATLVSGSSAELQRFDAYVSIIEASPEMLENLHQALLLLDEYAFIENRRAQLLAKNIRQLMNRLCAFGT